MPRARFPAPRSLNAFSVWLSLPQLITWGSVFYTFSLLMGPLEAELGMTRAESSLAFGLALLAEGAAAWQVGRWIDAGRERPVMVLGSLWVGLGLLAHSAIDSVAGFYAVWLWLGLGMAATLYTPAFAIATRRFGSDFRRAIITITFLGGLASTVFIPLVSWWMGLWGWRTSLMLLAALQLGLCLPLHLWLLRGAPRPGPLTSRPLPLAQQTAGTSVREHLRQPAFWLLALFMVLTMALTSALPVHMVNLLDEAGLPAHWVIGIPAAIGVLQVLGRLLLYLFERHWDVHAANRWIPALLPASLLVLLLGGWQPAAALVFVLLYGMGNGMLTIVKGTAMAQYVSAAHVGQLNGLLGLPTALARAAAPAIVGLLWSPEAGYRWGLWWMLLASLAGVVALWLAQARARP
ncbi:MAG: MFS transporter [Limnohabitans sp.]|jgi:MFS family permease